MNPGFSLEKWKPKQNTIILLMHIKNKNCKTKIMPSKKMFFNHEHKTKTISYLSGR